MSGTTLSYFAYSHLTKSQQVVAKPFAELAALLCRELPAGGARSDALFDLLVAKDSAVAAVPAYVPSGEPGPYGNG